MSKQVKQISPLLKARIAGTCQLLEALTATFGQVIILSKFVIPGNAAATAKNLLEHQQLFWLGFTTSILGVAFHIISGFLMYELLKPVNRSLSLLSAFVILVACAAQAFMALTYISPLIILEGGSSMVAFSPGQLQTFALMFFKLNTVAFNIHLALFGLWCFITGYLIFHSLFLPRTIGILLMISGLAWSVFLYPPLGYLLFAVIAAASAIGEIPLEFWLMIKGVHVQRWIEQAKSMQYDSNEYYS